MIRQSCSWCHKMNVVWIDDEDAIDTMAAILAGGVRVYCAECGHRADAALLDCDCRKCRPGTAVDPGPTTHAVECGGEA